MTDTDKLALSHILRATIDTLGARVGEPSMRYMVAEFATKGILNNPVLKESEAADGQDGVQLIRQLLVS